MRRFYLCIVLICLGGCSAPERTWTGHKRDVVWTAMLAVAQSPEYGHQNSKQRWQVLENDVNQDSSSGIIKVRRTIRRAFRLPRQEVQHDFRELIFQVVLLPKEPPATVFEELSFQYVPVRSTEEAARFFNQMDRLLNRD